MAHCAIKLSIDYCYCYHSIYPRELLLIWKLRKFFVEGPWCPTPKPSPAHP